MFHAYLPARRQPSAGKLYHRPEPCNPVSWGSVPKGTGPPIDWERYQSDGPLWKIERRPWPRLAVEPAAGSSRFRPGNRPAHGPELLRREANGQIVELSGQIVELCQPDSTADETAPDPASTVRPLSYRAPQRARATPVRGRFQARFLPGRTVELSLSYGGKRERPPPVTVRAVRTQIGSGGRI